MKIVFLCVDVPYKGNKASSYKNKQIIDYLKRDNEVKLVTLNDKYLEEFKAETGIEAEFVKSAIRPVNRLKRFFMGKNAPILNHFPVPVEKGSVERAVKSFAPDIIFYNSVGFAPYINDIINVKKICNVNKVLYMYYQRIANQYTFLRKKLYKEEAFRVGKYERNGYVNSDMILFTSINDMANVNSNMQLLTPSLYLPAYIEKCEFLPLTQEPHICIYGNYASKAGNLMYKDFVNNIHPVLKKKYGDKYKVYVTGNLARDMYKDEHIEFREEINEELVKDTRCLFLPYKFRVDLQYPSIIFMSYGIPIMGYNKSLDFFAVKEKSQYCITGDTPNQLKNNFFNSFENDAILNKIREKSFDYVKKSYSKEMFYKTMDDCMARFKK